MPVKAKVNGKDHSAVVLRVTDWDEKGRPSKVVVGYDDTVFDLRDESQSREFYTALVPTVMTARRTRGH